MRHYKKSFAEKIFDFLIVLFAVLLICVTLYPLVYTYSMAISDPIHAARGEVWLFPKGFSLMAIETVLTDDNVMTYYYNTLWYTIVGTITGIITTSLAAYPLSRPEFRYGPVIMKLITFTMFFGGGLIPTYLVITKYLGLYNSRLAIILPSLTSAWYIIVSRNFFASLPGDIIESARIDGASEYRIFLQLVMPLSKPILGVLALYYATGHWNAWFAHMLYLGKKNLHPLALYIRSVVLQTQLGAMNEKVPSSMNPEALLSTMQIKYAVIVISVTPMLCIYPFLSKNLEKGLMIGAVKG